MKPSPARHGVEKRGHGVAGRDFDAEPTRRRRPHHEAGVRLPEDRVPMIGRKLMLLSESGSANTTTRGGRALSLARTRKSPRSVSIVLRCRARSITLSSTQGQVLAVPARALLTCTSFSSGATQCSSAGVRRMPAVDHGESIGECSGPVLDADKPAAIRTQSIGAAELIPEGGAFRSPRFVGKNGACE